MTDIDQWVDAARSGEGWAFERLWLQFSGQVAGYLRARGVRAVEDVTSEVFLAAFQGIRRFEGGESAFRSWLFTIAHHQGVDDVRRGRRDHLTLVEDATEDAPAATATPSAEDQALGDTELRGWLDLLPTTQRDVIWLRFVVDLSVEEVAKVLGQSPGAVKQLQHRGIARLRRHLGHHPDGATSSPPVTSSTLLTIAEPR